METPSALSARGPWSACDPVREAFRCASIAVIDPRGERLDLADNGTERVGALQRRLTTRAFLEVLLFTSGKLFDIVFDVTGLPTVLSAATQMVHRMGKVVLVGDNTYAVAAVPRSKRSERFDQHPCRPRQP